MSHQAKEISRRDNCRLCSGKDLLKVLALEPTPIGDHYVPADRLNVKQNRYPLDLYMCSGCGHVQLLDVISPEILFRDYTFETSSSLGLVDHFRAYADSVSTAYPVAPGSLVVEIGSNDGSLLRFFKDKGYKVLGVDPATRIAEKATKSGIETLAQFFNVPLARQIVSSHGKASLICANNVYAHVDDLRGLTAGIKELLSPHGVFVFEASYLVDTLEKLLFDTIYHEHLCYHSIAPLAQFFDSLDLELFHVQHIETKGGSIRGFVQHKGAGKQRSGAVQEYIARESALKIGTPAPYAALADRLAGCRAELEKLLVPYKRAGKKIAGFGASVTATTLLYHLHLEKFLDVIVDDNKSRSGLYSPGAHIPVVSSDLLYDRNQKPAVVVILVWQYVNSILKRHKSFIEAGGSMLTPLPEVRALPA